MAEKLSPGGLPITRSGIKELLHAIRRGRSRAHRHLKGASGTMFSVLAASRCPQCRHEAVTDERVDACDIGGRKPTGEANHGLELIKSSAASLAYL